MQPRFRLVTAAMSLLLLPHCSHELDDRQECSSSAPCPDGQVCGPDHRCIPDKSAHDSRPDKSPEGGPPEGGAPDVSPADRGGDLSAPDMAADQSPPDLPKPDLGLPDAWTADGSPPGCGDGKKSPTEPCDGAALGGATCAGLGYTGGNLSCSGKCSLVTTGCYTLLTPKGFPVAQGTASQSRPDVGFAGKYLVVWQQSGGKSIDVLAQRVGKDGKLAGNVFPLSNASYDAVQPQMASDGAQHFVVWFDHQNTGKTYYNAFSTVVTASGTVLSPGGKYTGGGGMDKEDLVVAAGGGDYLVAWTVYYGGASTDWWDIAGALVSVTGTPKPQTVLRNQKLNQRSPHLASDGSSYFFAWLHYNAKGTTNTIVGGLTKGSTPLAGSTTICSHTKDKKDLRVAFDGTNYLVVWADARLSHHDIYGARVTKSGTVLDKEGFLIVKGTGYQDRLDLAVAGTRVMVVWHDTRDGDDDIYGVVVQGKQVLHPGGFPIAKGSDPADRPAVAHDGKNFLVVWQDNSNKQLDIHGTMVSLEPTSTP